MDIINFGKKLIFGRNGYSPKAQKILDQYGSKLINKIAIIRTPLSFLLSTTLNVISLGEFERSKPYDKLYHLAMILFLDDGNKILLEKNEVINLEINPNNYFNKHSDIKEISVYKVLSLNELLKKTQERMGKSFFPYDANTNNCQQFIVSIIRANDLSTPELEEFIKQDLNSLFKKLPVTKKIIDNVTELGSRIDVIKQGGSEIKDIKPNGINNGLYGDQIQHLLKNVKSFNGIYSKDDLPSGKLKNGWYVINLESSTDGHGTHWTCFYKNDSELIYYDAFGFIPPLEVLKKAERKPIFWSNKQNQNESSTCCGWFCVACILFNEKNKGTYKEKYNKFLNLFSSNTVINDEILKDLINKLI